MHVALRKESVDRNVRIMNVSSGLSTVALRKESVDRNRAYTMTTTICIASLSARRAWIEMVALQLIPLEGPTSLSARRAWIEIQVFQRIAKPFRGRSPQGERG